MEDRFNTQHTAAIELEVFGHDLLIAQDPNSKHLGTTVWDSSVVFVKYLERNCKKGEFSRAKLNGKRVIELGAGCGLAGLGLQLVEKADTKGLGLGKRGRGRDPKDGSLWPRDGTFRVQCGRDRSGGSASTAVSNVEQNMARASYASSEHSYLGPIGTVNVAELDWGNEIHVAAAEPPFDYIIGTDVVYVEHLLEPLISSMVALSGPKTTVVLGYEFRSSGVREQLHQLFSRYFDIKRVPHSKTTICSEASDECKAHSPVQENLNSGIVPLTGNDVCKSQPLEDATLFKDQASSNMTSPIPAPSQLSQVNDRGLSPASSTTAEEDGKDIGERVPKEESCTNSNTALNSSTCPSNTVVDTLGASVTSMSMVENCGVKGAVTDGGSEGDIWEMRRLGSTAARLFHNVHLPMN